MSKTTRTFQLFRLVGLIGVVIPMQPLIGHAKSVDMASVPNDRPPRLNASEKDSLVVTSKYYIGPEDVLDISVWRNKDLSKVLLVRPEGRISLPLIGDVLASGLTPI